MIIMKTPMVNLKVNLDIRQDSGFRIQDSV